MAEGGPPNPRGRGAALMAMLQKIQKEKEAAGVGIASEAPSPEPPKPKGRAAKLMEIMKARKVGAAAGESTTASSIPSPQPAASPVVQSPSQTSSSPVQQITKQIAEVEISIPRQPCLFQGSSGKPLNLSSNYIQLDIERGKGVFEYEVKFNPEIDARNNRFRLVSQVVRELGNVKVFDGGNKLYLPTKITDTHQTYCETIPGGDQQVTVSLIFKKQMSLGHPDCLHLYNVLFKKIMRELLFVQMGRNYFSPEHKNIIPQHKLEVYPGFAVSVDEREGGLMINLDTTHRVLRTQNAYELMNDLKRSTNPRMFKETVLSNMLGSCVFTRYNNKTYIVDDILWDVTPQNTFPTRDGREITFVEYYKTQYDIDIRDRQQPMLLHRQKVKKSGSADTEDRLISLVPELCFMTGLTDTMRNDFKVMKDVAQYTRVTPQQRVLALRKYIDNVRKSEKAQQILAEWGLSLPASYNLNLAGRQLETEQIIFGNHIVSSAGHIADWNRELANNPVILPVDLRNWVVFYTQQDTRYAREFSQHMVRLAGVMGCIITQPRMEVLPNDHTATYVNYVKSKIDSKVQVAVFICPSMRSDRYAVIKKLCSAQIPVASQVINAKTLSKPDKVRSIILKIALQINCKLGGSLWSVKFPFQSWMICGIDVYHGSPPNSVCGFVASLNESISRWYSLANFQRQELGDFYKMAFTKALEKYKNECGNFPTKVIIIRDGVGDGQLEYAKRYEVAQFEEVLKLFGLDVTLCFIVVQKRINTRVFSINRGSADNPPPGTVLDHTVTRRYLYDFYLVPQSVRQGTVNPTHYIVLHDTCKLKPDHVQRLCYKLCHLYYNWPGTIRVPAPCQYAHKLAGMVGQHVKTLPAPELADKLWYL